MILRLLSRALQTLIFILLNGSLRIYQHDVEVSVRFAMHVKIRSHGNVAASAMHNDN